MASNEQPALNWAELEARQCVGNPIHGQNHNQKIYLARIAEHDFRKAEALCLTGKTDFLQLLRTQIARGHIREAKQNIAEFIHDAPELGRDPEWKLELARIFNFNNQWQECVRECGEVIQLSPTTPTRMTALQVRSNAYYELGEWKLALRDIEIIRSLATLYPDASVSTYAEVSAARVFSELGQIARADAALENIWQRLSQKNLLNLDNLLTLMRAEFFLCLAKGEYIPNISIASAALAEKLGDEQYAALARLEIYCGSLPDATIREEIKEDCSRFPRVRSLLEEIKSGKPKSTSARALKRLGELPEKSACERSTPTAGIILQARKLLIFIDPFTTFSLAKPSKIVDALLLVAQGSPIAKADFFEKLYHHRYAPHLHDALIHQLLSRIRRRWPLEVRLSKVGIELVGIIRI